MESHPAEQQFWFQYLIVILHPKIEKGVLIFKDTPATRRKNEIPLHQHIHYVFMGTFTQDIYLSISKKVLKFMRGRHQRHPPAFFMVKVLSEKRDFS